MMNEITTPSAEVLARNLDRWRARPLTRREISDLVATAAAECGYAVTDLASARLVDLLMKYQRNGLRVSSDVISAVLSRLA